MMQAWQHFSFILPAAKTTKPDVAISACLKGEAVRYDGTAKVLPTISVLSDALNLIPVCPEVAAGMSVPRPPIELMKSERGLEALGRDDADLNMTEPLQLVAEQSLKQLPDFLAGYIFKSKSPSCGLASTPIYNKKKRVIAKGNGLQADYFSKQKPWLMFREELQLQTQAACQQFIFCCYVLRDIQQASNKMPLSVIHDHYQTLVKNMSAQRQQQLLALQHGQSQTVYWQSFKVGLEEIVFS